MPRRPLRRSSFFPLLAGLSLACAALSLLAPTGAQAQGSGPERGFVYGGAFRTPIFPTGATSGRDPATGRPADIGIQSPGFGVQLRLGWQFDVNLVVEAQVSIEGAVIDQRVQLMEGTPTFTDINVGFAARYYFWEWEAFIPFVGLGADIQIITFDNGTRAAQGEAIPSIRGILGAQSMLAPWMGLYYGVDVSYLFEIELFNEGVITFAPFLGVTLYLEEPELPRQLPQQGTSRVAHRP